jgi:hypothetical protein
MDEVEKLCDRILLLKDGTAYAYGTVSEVRRKHRFITMEDIDEAILKVQMGPEKRSRKMSENARRLTAYHESGHAVASKFCEHTDPVHYITIIPRGAAGGFTLYRPDADAEDYTTRAEMFERIVTALGGRMAEKLFLDDISTGASGDIQQASAIARDMVTKYGMSERLGPIKFDSSDQSIFIGRDFGTTKSYSEETAAAIDEEVKERVIAQLRQSFRPEFLNRLDETVFYKPLTRDDIDKIVDLLLAGISKRLEDKQLSLSLTPAAREFIIDNGYDPQYGARPLKRFLQSKVETLIAVKIVRDDPAPGDVLTVDFNGKELVIK